MTFSLTSSAFANNQAIPRQYTCDGQDISPPLTWNDPPPKTISFALVMDDHDAPAGIWTHWLLYNIPGTAQGLVGAIRADATLKDGSKHGKNSWRRLGYNGPCPPGGIHRYSFKLYALDFNPDLQTGIDKNTLLLTINSHILAETSLTGTYRR